MGVAAAWVGPYRVLEKLGAGAMGEVYLAEDTRLRRRVALKTVLHPEITAPKARQRLLREARAVARLNHPHIAAIYDVVESPSSIHIVMEYVRGETLAARLRRGSLPPATVVAIGIQLADALTEAHAMGVIHRDLKPANVIVTPEDQVKVLDFGLARTRDRLLSSGAPSGAADPGSGVHEVAGTPPYVPPEIFMGGAADARGDIYSLGVTLFEMLTGRRPFKGADMNALGIAILTEPTPRARQVERAVPEGLDAIVARAMARKPEDRHASSAELAAALRAEQELIAEAPTEPRAFWRPPRWRSPRVLARSSPLVWGALAAVLALGAYAFLRSGRLPVSPPSAPASAVVAVLPLANATGDPANDHLGAGIADVLITALAEVPGVTMVSRSATLPYRDRNKDVASIASDLGADMVVDGAVQASGGKVRVTLSLLRPDTNRVSWSGTYDGAFADIFALQNEAAAAVSKALQVRLTPDERRRLQRPPTANVEALADYAQARSFLERPDVEENLERSITLFQSAITRDPRFARAHAGLGQTYWIRFQKTKDAEWSDRALLATTEALRLDPEDASARQALAVVYAGRGRTEEAFEELRRAVLLQPTSDEAHSLLGEMLNRQGRREEAAAELKKAIALRPNYWHHHYALGIVHFDAGRYPEAAAAFRRVTELQPDSSRGFYMLGSVHLASGDSRQAIESFQRAIALRPDAGASTNLGFALYGEGRYAEAAAAFEEAARLTPKSPIKQGNLGDVYRRLGDSLKARKAYQRAVDLATLELRTNPRDARALSNMAIYEAKLGRRADAARHADEAVELGPGLGDVMYRKAIVLAVVGRSDESLAALQRAFAQGYSRSVAGTDEDLRTLRDRPEFQRMISEGQNLPAKGGSK